MLTWVEDLLEKSYPLGFPFVVMLVFLSRLMWNYVIYEPRHDKTSKLRCAQRRLRSACASTVWSESLLCAQWVAKDPRFLYADSEDSDQTGRMPRLIWVFAWRTAILLVLSCRGSYIYAPDHCLCYLFCHTGSSAPYLVEFWAANWELHQNI